MKPSQLKEYLKFTIENNFPVLIKGKPGIGKSDIVAQATKNADADLIITHPVVSDPTDYKGLPFAQNGEAMFLPFSDLKKLIEAKKKTVFFIDDLGQAPASVQAAIMQLLLAREINGHKVSDNVVFIAATNRKEDKAAVSGLLEPVKSRFASIIELEVSSDDWVNWALNNNMPIELISFIRFRPDTLDNFIPSKDIVNSASPRTVAFVGKQQMAGLPKAFRMEVFKGAAGQEFATEYVGFLDLFDQLPKIEEIILSPKTAPVPEGPSAPAAKYALSALLSRKMDAMNIGSFITYLGRLGDEIEAACFQNVAAVNRKAMNNKEYIKWATNFSGFKIEN